MRRAQCILLTVALLACVPLSAQSRDGNAYIYDSRGYAVPCPDPYEPIRLLAFADPATGGLNYPQDMTIGRDGHLLISDQGQARVLEVTAEGTFVREIRNPLLGKPAGIFYDQRDASLYVSDEASASILHFSATGRLLRVFSPPRSDVLPANYLYSPTRVLVDGRGWLSVIGTGSSGGIIQIDADGVFRGFFGANPAPTSLIRKLSRLVASKEQKSVQLLQVLQPCSDFVLEEDGFVATVTDAASSRQIRRLNPLGASIFAAGVFGEPIPATDSDGRRVFDHAHLAFIAADAQGNITVADRTTLKLFQYSPEGELLFIWGGKGTQRGSFQSISEIALDTRDGTLYVLDGLANAVQAFAPTEFARLVQKAGRLYADGRYEEAVGVWADVRARDSNYPLANKGIARVLLRLGTALGRTDYLRSAMARSADAGDREEFSAAFSVARRLWVQSAMPYLVLAAIALLSAVVVLSRRRGGRTASGMRAISPFRLWRVLLHPFAVMEDVKWACSGATVGAATLAVVLAFAARIFMISATSFPFTTWDTGQISLGSEAARLFLPFITWVGANALVTAIFRGEGKIRQIFSASAFALVPYILMTVLLTLASHVLSLSERGAYDALRIAMAAWTVLLFLLGASIVHGYTLRGALGTSLLSVAGIVILWGVAVLVLGLVSTFVGFIVDIVREVTLRG